MAKTYNRLELDVNKKPNSIGIRPVQGDTKSRYLDVCLYENGMPINLTGEQVRITFRKADGSTFFNQGEVTDATTGRCQFALTNEILSEAKAVEAQISVWNAGGQILSTQVFEIYVTAAIPWADAVESENEYGVLVVLFQEIQDALDTMHKIATTFGEPGDKAAEYGVDTFWGILEMLAQRGDVESSLQKGIKAYLNSTIETSGFLPLDKMLPAHGTQTFTEDGTFTVPASVHKILITACGGGGGGKSISGGWGADYIVKRAFSVEPNAVIPITVGKGGLGQDANSDPEIEATDGGTTIIGNLITISGGFKGGDNTRIHKGTKGGEDTVFAIAGLQGTSSGGSSGSTGGQGGGACFGNGGNGGTNGKYTIGKDATNGGTGAGGGGRAQRVGNSSSSYSKAGNGGDGIVIIEW